MTDAVAWGGHCSPIRRGKPGELKQPQSVKPTLTLVSELYSNRFTYGYTIVTNYLRASAALRGSSAEWKKGVGSENPLPFLAHSHR